MTDRPASWRMPSPKEMEKLATEAARQRPPPVAAPENALPAEYWDAVLKDPRAATGGSLTRQRRLSEMQGHVLRVCCRRGDGSAQVTKADPVRPYGSDR